MTVILITSGVTLFVAVVAAVLIYLFISIGKLKTIRADLANLDQSLGNNLADVYRSIDSSIQIV